MVNHPESTSSQSPSKTRSEYLHGKTELSDVDIINILDLPVEKENRTEIKSYTEHDYSDLKNDEKNLSKLAERLEKETEYLSYHGSYIAKSKLLYEPPVTLCNEIPCLLIGHEINEKFYLLPYGYAKDSSEKYKKFADMLESKSFIDIKRNFGSSIRNNFKKGHQQGKNIFFFINGNDLTYESCKKELCKCVYNRKNNLDKTASYIIYEEKSNRCGYFIFDSHGKLADETEYHLKEIRSFASERPLVVRGGTQSIPSSTPVTINGKNNSVNDVFNSLLIRGEISMLRKHTEIKDSEIRYQNALNLLEAKNKEINDRILQSSNNKFIQKEKELSSKTRSEYLQGKTELSDIDIINILDLPVEKRSINNEIYTDKSYKELKNNPEELSSLTENLKTKPEYLKYHSSYIAKSKLLYQESDVLCNEIPCLIVLNQLKKTTYLLPYEYAANKYGAAITSADALKSNTFTDFKRVFNKNLRHSLEKGSKQGRDIFFLLNNENIDYKSARKQLEDFVNSRKLENKEAEYLFFSEKDFVCYSFESDKNGFITEFPEYDLKEIRAAIPSKPLTPSRKSGKSSDSLASNLNITQENFDVNDLKQIRLANADKPLIPNQKTDIKSVSSSDNFNITQENSDVNKYENELFNSLLLRGEISSLEILKDIENRQQRYFNAVKTLEKLNASIHSEIIKKSNSKFIEKEYNSRFFKSFANTQRIVYETGKKQIKPETNLSLSKRIIELVNPEKSMTDLANVIKNKSQLLLKNPELKDVVFDYGNFGDLTTEDSKGGFGIAHIIQRRNEKDGLTKDEIAGLLILIKHYTETEKPDCYDKTKTRAFINKSGIRIILQKNWNSNNSSWIVSGYGLREPNDKIKTEAIETIRAVSAQYGYKPEHSFFREQVGATIASIQNIRQHQQNVKIVKKQSVTETGKKQISTANAKTVHDRAVLKSSAKELPDKQLFASLVASYYAKAALKNKNTSLLYKNTRNKNLLQQAADKKIISSVESELKKRGYFITVENSTDETTLNYKRTISETCKKQIKPEEQNMPGSTEKDFIKDFTNEKIDTFNLEENPSVKKSQGDSREKLNAATYKFQSNETLDEIIQSDSSFSTEAALLDNLIDCSIREVYEYATEKEQRVLRVFASFRNDYDTDMKNLAIQTDCAARWIAAKHWNPEKQEFQKEYVNRSAIESFPYELPWEMEEIEKEAFANQEKELPALKTHSDLKEEKIQNLQTVTQEEFNNIVDSLYQPGKPDYKNIPEIIRLPKINSGLAEKLGIENENFFMKTNVAHVRPQRKGGYDQSLRKEEMKGMLDFISSCQTAYIDSNERHQNFFLAGLDEQDNTKANKIVFNKDKLGNYIVTIGKFEARNLQEKEYTKVAVGVEPTIWGALKEPPIATMLRSSTTLATENIQQKTEPVKQESSELKHEKQPKTESSNQLQDQEKTMENQNTEPPKTEFSNLKREERLQKMTGTLTPEEQKRYFTFNEADTAKFKFQVDEWKKSKDENSRFNPGKLIEVGEIPPLFNALGIADNPIEVQYSTLSKLVRPLPEGYPNEAQGHALSVDDIYSIPKQLADPVMVFKSRTRNDSYVFFTERKDSQNRSILIPMAVNKRKGRIVINEITSMYGRNNEIDFVKTNIDEGNLIYADKKRSLEWERECKVQFLTQGLPSQDSIGNILTKENIVKFISTDVEARNFQENSNPSIKKSQGDSMNKNKKNTFNDTPVFKNANLFLEENKKGELPFFAGKEKLKDGKEVIEIRPHPVVDAITGRLVLGTNQILAQDVFLKTGEYPANINVITWAEAKANGIQLKKGTSGYTISTKGKDNSYNIYKLFSENAVTENSIGNLNRAKYSAAVKLKIAVLNRQLEQEENEQNKSIILSNLAYAHLDNIQGNILRPKEIQLGLEKFRQGNELEARTKEVADYIEKLPKDVKEVFKERIMTSSGKFDNTTPEGLVKNYNPLQFEKRASERLEKAAEIQKNRPEQIIDARNCTSSTTFIAKYAAATSLAKANQNVKFITDKSTNEKIQKDLNATLEKSFSEYNHSKVFSIGEEANEQCRAELKNFRSQQQAMKSQENEIEKKKDLDQAIDISLS